MTKTETKTICPGCGNVNEYANEIGAVEGPREYHAECWLKTIVEIRVYWDNQDRSNEGWAWKTTDAAGRTDSGPIDILPTADLDDAIDQACHELDVPVDHNDFATCKDDGGWAHWSRP